MSREPRIRLIEDNRVAGEVWEDDNGDLVLEESESGETIRVGSLGTAVSKLSADTIEANDTSSISLASTLDAQQNELTNIGSADMDNLSVNDWEWLDVKEAGLTSSDDAGDFIRLNAADNRLLVFPPGTYNFDTPATVTGVENFGVYCPTGGAVFSPRNISNSDPIMQFGTETTPGRQLLIKGIETDTQNQSLIDLTGEVVVEDIRYLAEKTQTGSTFNLKARTVDKDRTAVVRNVEMLQGGAHQGLADPSNEAGGIYVDPDHAGTIKFENCRLGGFPNNGLYASGPGESAGGDGRVFVEGGYYENSSVSNVRVGGSGSKVEDVTISMNTLKTDFTQLRGLVCRNAGGHTFENVRIEMSIDNSMAVQHSSQAGSADYDGVTIHDTSTGSKILDLSQQDATDPRPVTMSSFEVYGSSTYSGTYPIQAFRDHCNIENWRVNLPNNAAFWVDADNVKIERSDVIGGTNAMLDQGTNTIHKNNSYTGGASYGTRPIINGTGQEAAGAGNPPTAANWDTGDQVENTDDNTVWLKTTADTMVQLG